MCNFYFIPHLILRQMGNEFDLNYFCVEKI